MLSPILLVAAVAFGLLAGHVWPAEPALAGTLGGQAVLALLIGAGVAQWGAGSAGMVGLVTVQVVLVGPTLYCAWRAEFDGIAVD